MTSMGLNIVDIVRLMNTQTLLNAKARYHNISDYYYKGIATNHSHVSKKSIWQKF